MTIYNQTTTADTSVSRRATNGALAGLVGGLVFGVMMGIMGMLPMIAGLVGSTSALVGFIVHMIISAIIGVGYGLLFGGGAAPWGSSLVAGALYGVVWWFLGPLLIMPSLMGMGPQLSAAGMSAALPSLVGHILYGLVTAAAYERLRSR